MPHVLDHDQPLTHHLTVPDEQAALVRRLIARQPAADHDRLLNVLGLNNPADQP